MNNDVVNTYNELLKRLSDTEKALENNAQLYDSEIITKEEFETKKSNIFNKENIYSFTNKIVDKKVDNVYDSEKTEYIYNQALKLYPKAKTIGDYSFIINQLKFILGYKDSNKIYIDCKKRKQELINVNTYKKAKENIDSNNIDLLTVTRDNFLSLGLYLDSEKLANECNDKINGIKAKEKERKRRNRNITLGSIATAIIVITVILLTTLVFVPLGRQNNIKTLITEGKYEEAQNLIDENGSFGETKKLEVMCEAGEAFEDLDYEKGIKEICSIGGSVTIYYDSNGTTIDKESEVITSFDSINNSIYKEGYKEYTWVLTNYSTKASDYTAIIYLKAEYLEAIKYYISYNLNGGEFNTSYDKKYTVESEDITIPNPIKKGYTFLGWTSGTITTPTKDLIIESGSIGDIVLIANWQANTYTIIYDVNTGDVLDTNTQYITFGNTITLPVPTKTEYTFEGWYNGENLVQDGNWNIASNVTLKASWKIISYDITYIGIDGANNQTNPATYTYETATITLQDPTKKGYTFLGWTSGTITTPTKDLVIESGSSGDIFLTANWEVNTYTITYDVNTGDALDTNIQYITFGNAITLPVPTKTEYTFEGWYNGENLVQDGNWNIASNVTLKASWKIISYDIIYIGVEGANNQTNPATYTYETATITLQDPTRAGSIFLGWTTSDVTSPTKNLSITRNSTGAKEFNANWKVYYTYTDSTETSLYFGSYPQTNVWDSSLISTLNTKAGTLPTSENVYNWTDDGNYMYYIDIDNDNDGVYDYRGIYFTQYRHYKYGSTSSKDYSYQDNNGYRKNNTYWFKYEPIKWNILKAASGKALIISELLLDLQIYGPGANEDYQGNTKDTDNYNNYMYSHIRSWLNETFYETVFSTLEKEIIETTIVDNSESSTGDILNECVCGNTSDKMFLLSYQEATTYYSSNSERQAKGTEYAKSQGLWVSSSSSYSGYSNYWLRSPCSYDDGLDARYVKYFGNVGDGGYVCSNIAGVRPACWINLEIN